MKLTLARIKASRLPKTLGLTASDPRLVQYLNEVVERYGNSGDFKGTSGRFRFCVTSSCLTLPRQIEAVRGFTVCGRPGRIHNDFYEFIGDGPGHIRSTPGYVGIRDMVQKGRACAFDDILGDNSTIQVYCDRPEDAGATILLQGNEAMIDASGAIVARWIDTVTAGVRLNGEAVPLLPTAPATFTQSAYTWIRGGLISVQKPVTNGIVRLFEYDQTLGTRRPLAYYEPDETIPDYVRIMLPGIETAHCLGSTGTCSSITLEVLAKLAFIPVVNDEDFLMIQNFAALKLGCMAVLDEEADNMQAAQEKWAMGIKDLNEELGNEHLGQRYQVQAQSSHTWGGGVPQAL